MEQRVCRQCLLQEYDQAAYQELLEKELRWMDGKMRADEELYQERLTACRACEKLQRGTCLACGCYVELRAAAKGGRCPKKRW